MLVNRLTVSINHDEDTDKYSASITSKDGTINFSATELDSYEEALVIAGGYLAGDVAAIPADIPSLDGASEQPTLPVGAEVLNDPLTDVEAFGSEVPIPDVPVDPDTLNDPAE